MNIRECKLEDYLRLWEITKTALGYDFPAERMKERLIDILKQPSHKIFVACEGDKVIGYVHGNDYDCFYSEPLKNVLGLAVDEYYRCIGAGRALMTALEDWARSCGCVGVRLVSGGNRTGAHAFYLRCGYETRKEQKNFIKYF